MDVRSTVGEPRVLINREAILHNARILRRAVGPQVSLCAVIKADAYGHGANIVAETLSEYALDEMGNPPVNTLAVATIDEALALGEPAIPVMVLRPIENGYVGRQKQQIEAAIRNGWILTVCSPSAADDVARIAMHAGGMAWVQVMIDTGMSRSGVSRDRFAEVAQRIEKHVSLRLFGFATHFACADSADDPFTTVQLDQFDRSTRAITAARRQRGAKVVRHAAKMEPPLRNLATGNGGESIITCIAEITVHGRSLAGDVVSASGRLQITFANFGG